MKTYSTYSIVHQHGMKVDHYFVHSTHHPLITEVVNILNLTYDRKHDLLLTYLCPTTSNKTIPVILDAPEFSIGVGVNVDSRLEDDFHDFIGTVIGFRNNGTTVCVRDQEDNVWDCNPLQLTPTEDPEDDMS